ncbi:MAG TPA: hypothetical protein ENF33_03235 [Nitrososphaeria archaeon]|nr:hypothetical protein [Nitrososphaeria archaeon]
MMVKKVILPSRVADSLLEMARLAYPLEMLALLRGKKKGDGVYIEELLFAPLSEHGSSSVYFRFDLMPMDLTIVGLAHSHPSGIPKPSLEDLHNFIGRVMLILIPPFSGYRDIYAFNSDGENLRIVVEP